MTDHIGSKTSVEREPEVRFKPSRVVGFADVQELVVRPTRLEFHTTSRVQTFELDALAPRLTLFLRLPALWGKRILRPVGERDWFNAPGDRFFTWYTTPRITTFMPNEEDTDYGSSRFARIHAVLAAGGFCTNDLG